MAFNGVRLEMDEEQSIDTDKLTYEIFSILETKFLFGYDDDNNKKLWIPKQVPEPRTEELTESSNSPLSVPDGDTCPRIRILSIDGGGCSAARGVLPCAALTHLERTIRKKSGNPNATIAEYFDIVAGTGVGGIVAAMLVTTGDGARPDFGAEDAWRVLTEQGKSIFNFNNGGSGGGGLLRRLFGGGGGGGKGLEKFLMETFSGAGGAGGKALTLKDTLKPLLIPCYDLSTAAPFLFSRADALESDGYDFRLWEVCRATAAEPGVVEPVQMRSVDGKNRCVGLDGGLVMGNPTAAAITHVLHNKKEFPHVRGVEDLLVLSLGMGHGIDDVAGLHQYENVKGWKAKEWARPAVRITGDGSADLVDQAVGMAFGRCRPGTYVRIQANGSGLVHDEKKLGEIAEQMLKQKNAESALFGGKNMSDSTNFEKLDSFAAELVLEHDRRRSCETSSSLN